jgi:hypothetical protein
MIHQRERYTNRKYVFIFSSKTDFIQYLSEIGSGGECRFNKKIIFVLLFEPV